VISSLISRSSAGAFAFGGLLMLFAPDLLLSALIPGFPPSGLWLGQLLGAAWLGLAWMNWVNRTVLIGGIYARAVVGANAVCYFVGATSLLTLAARGAQPAGLPFTACGQRQLGPRGVSAGRRPGGLPVPQQYQLSHGTESASNRPCGTWGCLLRRYRIPAEQVDHAKIALYRLLDEFT